MPLFDRACPDCGWIARNLMEPSVTPQVFCPDCGAPTERAWLSKSATVIGDEMDHLQINGVREPRRFRSKQEHKRWLKENNYVINDGHTGTQDSDKSKHSTRWAAMDPQTLANARELVTRASLEPARSSSDDDGPRGITSDEGVIRYLSDRAKTERGEYL